MKERDFFLRTDLEIPKNPKIQHFFTPDLAT